MTRGDSSFECCRSLSSSQGSFGGKVRSSQSPRSTRSHRLFILTESVPKTFSQVFSVTVFDKSRFAAMFFWADLFSILQSHQEIGLQFRRLTGFINGKWGVEHGVFDKDSDGV